MATPVSAIAQDQFLQLLVTQLQNQDPFNPITDQEFITQLTSLSTLQGIEQLNASFAQILRLQQLTNGASLLGKTVEYELSSSDTTQVGIVDSVRVQNSTFVLQIGTDEVKLDQIISVRS
jgi:flagellar basal-body rod modification protein FlgD